MYVYMYTHTYVLIHILSARGSQTLTDTLRPTHPPRHICAALCKSELQMSLQVYHKPFENCQGEEQAYLMWPIYTTLLPVGFIMGILTKNSTAHIRHRVLTAVDRARARPHGAPSARVQSIGPHWLGSGPWAHGAIKLGENEVTFDKLNLHKMGSIAY